MRRPRKAELLLVFAASLVSVASLARAAESAETSSTLDFANGLYARKMYAPAIGEYEKFIETNPASPEVASAKFRRADSYYFTKNYKSAIFYFDEFLKQHAADPRATLARFRLGSSNYHLGNFDAADRMLVAVAKEARDPNVRSAALFYLAKCREGAKKPEQAVALYRQLVKGYPQSEYASYSAAALGDFYLERKSWNEAIDAYRFAAEKKYPAEIALEARFRLAEIRFELKQYKEAASDYEAVLAATEPSAAERPSAGALKTRDKALLGLFHCDFQLRDAPAARRRLESQAAFVKKSAYEPEVLFIVGELEADAGNYAAAIARFGEVIAHPKADESLRARATVKKSASLSKTGSKESALEEIQKLFGTGPAGESRAYYEKAKVLDQMGRPAEALENYAQLVKLYPESEFAKAALFQSAVLRLKQKDTAGARAEFARYAEKYPADENAGGALLETIQIDLDAKNFESAAAIASKFEATRPKDPLADVAAYKRAAALAGLGKFDEAAAAFTHVLDFPETKLKAEALFGAAAASESAGNIDEAVAFNERLAREMKGHPLTNEALSRLGYLYIRSEQAEKAEELYQDILRFQPQVRIRPEEVFWLIQRLLDKSQYAAIQETLPLLPQRFPDQDFGHEMHFFLGESFMGMKDFPRAAQHYAEALEAKRDGIYAPYCLLGQGIAAAAQKDRAAAEKFFTEALRYDYEVRVVMRARFEVANLRLGAGDLEEAAKGFMLVAILYDDPKFCPPALFKAAECYRKLNKPDEAAKALDELGTRYPKSPWAQTAQRQAAEAKPHA